MQLQTLLKSFNLKSSLIYIALFLWVLALELLLVLFIVFCWNHAFSKDFTRFIFGTEKLGFITGLWLYFLLDAIKTISRTSLISKQKEDRQ